MLFERLRNLFRASLPAVGLVPFPQVGVLRAEREPEPHQRRCGGKDDGNEEDGEATGPHAHVNGRAI
jgi:hypothetical protein